MAVTFRTRHVPPEFQALLREAADAALQGDWRITLLQSHLDGQWNLQLEGAQTRCRVVFSSLETVTLAGLTLVLQQLADDRLGGVSLAPAPPAAPTGEARSG